jgi:hypothetical protein
MTDGWLTGWQEIANYMGKSVRTAQNWEKKHFLPVCYDPGGRPICIKSQLNHWLCNYNKKKLKSA